MGRYLHVRFVATVFTTPQELRRIADEMERVWANAQAGQSLEVDKILSEEAEIVFCCDQSRMTPDRLR